ncbi:FkbM family methyltransferase [Geminicoccus roseus]|uniref:FkbM family methyltransferase n=1 Tax=Geminicoccus roseus TaxID=404900 RepID=UPI000406E78F|nr:FkbM family methyltransferase [Geminicoccus roseus]
MVLRRLIRGLGYDLVKRGKTRDVHDQLVGAMHMNAIDAVLDVGANEGQYGRRLRRHGWYGPIVSFEPQTDVHARLMEVAGRDRDWIVAPPMALGAEDGVAVLECSAESDMSSLLPQNPTLQKISPSSAVTASVEVPLHRLDGLPQLCSERFSRMLLKVDVQGSEMDVLEGAAGILDRIVGIQLETALVPLYVGEQGFRTVLDRLDDLGFDLHLLIPGYYERKLGRQLQVDVVAFRDGRAT